MSRLLLDPLLLVPVQLSREAAVNIVHFVERLTKWATDERAAVGTATLQLVCAYYGEKGYPDAPIGGEGVPRYLQREYGRSLNRLLVRVVDCERPLVEHVSSPTYRGPAEYGTALICDLAGGVRSAVAGVATDYSHWDPESCLLTLDPGPPESSELCATPGAELAYEHDASVRTFFADRRLHVVGGRPRDSVPTELARTLGVDPSNVTWMPAEKGKPPRGIRARWSGLDPVRDVTACLTGCIGHAESEAAARAAAARGVRHFRAETVADLVEAMRLAALQP